MHLARLAKLSLSPSEPAGYSRELTKIIEYFDCLAIIDTDEIDDAPRSVGGSMVREDAVWASLTAEKALMNAPEKKDNYIIVPRVI